MTAPSGFRHLCKMAGTYPGIAGQYPKSGWKIFFLILLISLSILMVLYLGR